MARGERSHVRKRRRGCLSGCLTNILLLLGVFAVLFVGACVLGFVKNDPETGEPSLSLEGVGIDGLDGIQLPDIDLPDIGSLCISLPDISGISLPQWAYGVSKTGLTVKTLRAGEGEAVLVCCDGYTMLVGSGSGSGILVCGQLLLSGVSRLGVAVATCAEEAQIGAMPMVLRLTKPDYLLYQDSQTKGTAYNSMIAAAEKIEGMHPLVPTQGLTFSLGYATVTALGPARTNHTDERDDGLSLRIDYGGTSVLIMGTVTAAGEREIITSGARLDADALICARGGSDAATCSEFVSAVSPKIALMTGKSPANSVKIRLQKAGAEVYTMQENGVMTLFSDGQTVEIVP